MVISHFINISIEILIYFLVSIVCLFIGRKVLDWITQAHWSNGKSACDCFRNKHGLSTAT